LRSSAFLEQLWRAIQLQTCLRMGYQYVRRTGARVYGVVNLSAAESVLPVPIAQFNNE